MDYLNYISPELFVLIPVLYAIGTNLKHTEKVSDKYIPTILTVISVALTTLYVIASQGITLTGVLTGFIQGVLVSAVAVYTNQLIKQKDK